MLKNLKSTFKKMLAFSLILSLVIGSFNVFADTTGLRDLNKSSSYAREAIEDLYNQGIIAGDNLGNFNPSKNITRAEMVTLLVRVLGLDIKNPPAQATFKDVPTNHWAFPYVEAAYKNGIVTGVAPDRFGVNDLSTREQMAALFVRALKIKENDIKAIYGTQSVSNLSDRKTISSWANSYVEFALSTGLMTGTSFSTFAPKQYAKKEQVAVVTHRFLDNMDSITNLPMSPRELKPEQVAVLKKSVVKIRTYNKAGALMDEGSGFAVGKGLFLTAYSVLEGASRYTVTDISGRVFEAQGIAKYSADLDLAIIKTKEQTSIAPLKLGSKADVAKADQIITIGYPEGTQNMVTYGIVSGVRKFEYGSSGVIDMIQVTTKMGSGSMGGATIDMKGNVVGIASSINEDGNIKLATAIDHAKPWIQELQAKSFSSITVLDMSKAVSGYLDTSDATIKNAIYKIFRALEGRDINAYMANVHPMSPAYKIIEEEYKAFLLKYNLDYDIVSMDIVEKSYSSAEVDLVYTIKRLDMNEPDSLRAYERYSLEKYNGEWRIFNISQTLQTYPKEDRYDTGTGAISQQEALWAYQEEARRAAEEVKINGTALRFMVADSVMHPTKPIIYISDMYSKKVYAYNYATGETKAASFNLAPENLAFAGNEIYVSLLKGKHSSYWFEDQKGAIAIVDSETMQIKEQFDIDIDPFDIVAGRDGYIYVTSGSGQHTEFRSYSRKTLQQVSTATQGEQSYAELHPAQNIIYTVDNSSPTSIVTYKIADGKFTDPPYPGGMSWSNYGQYVVGRRFVFSPDGSYLITSAGSVFATKYGGPAYETNFGREFIDAAFAPDGKSFFTGIKGGMIYQYSCPGFKAVNTYKVDGEIVKLYFKDNKLIVITTANNKYYIETVQTK